MDNSSSSSSAGSHSKAVVGKPHMKPLPGAAVAKPQLVHDNAPRSGSVLMTGRTVIPEEPEAEETATPPAKPAVAGAAATMAAAMFGAGGGAASPGRPSMATIVALKKRVVELRARHRRARPPAQRLENTYRIDPDGATGRYRPASVRKVMQHSLAFFLDGMRYEARAAAKICKVIADDVKRRVKATLDNADGGGEGSDAEGDATARRGGGAIAPQPPRYKLVVLVSLTHRGAEGVCEASQTLSDARRDVSVALEHRTATCQATARVHAMYYE